MGAPGLPIMAGVLAVPVGVLLFVLVLAMMGRRWALAGPDEALMAEYDAGYEDDDLEFEPAPSPRSAYDPYGPSYAEPARDPYGSPAREPYGAPARETYSAPVSESYSAPVREPYASPRSGSSGVSDWEPYVPGPRRSPERPSWSEYGPAADSYGRGSTRSATDPYGASQDSYGSSQDFYGSARDSYGSPAAYDSSDAYDRGAYDDPPAYGGPRHAGPEDPQGFPYGPYGPR